MSDVGVRSAADRDMTCDEVAELSGLYVLDALEPEERAAVDAHLSSCPEEHPEFEEVGGVVPALASLAEPVEAPGSLKASVMEAFDRERSPAPRIERRVEEIPLREAAPGRWQFPAWSMWPAAVTAVLIVAVIGVWGLGLQSRADQAERRAEILADAIAAFSAPDSSVAVIRGTGTADGASGFAAFPASGPGYLVMVGLPPAGIGRIYQAWYLVDGQPSSAGLMTVDADGYAILSGVQPTPGTNLVALTIEQAQGSDHPTTDVIASGEVRRPG